MGAPSGCSVSVPVTRLAGASGTLRSVVVCAAQRPPAGEVSNSSCPTVCPSSWIVNLPLSCAKTARCCVWEARARELTAARHRATTPHVIFDLKGLRIMETTPCTNTNSHDCQRQSLPHKRCEARRSCALALRMLPALDGDFAGRTATLAATGLRAQAGRHGCPTVTTETESLRLGFLDDQVSVARDGGNYSAA